MKKKIREAFNGDLTNPLTLNILIYTVTFVLCIIYSIICYKGYFSFSSLKEFEVSNFLKILTDCIVPTTATLVLGNVIQNIALACQAGIKRFELSIWALLAVFAYMLLYPVFKDCGELWFCIIVCLISAGIVILGMSSVIQIENESNKNIKSLSG